MSMPTLTIESGGKAPRRRIGRRSGAAGQGRNHTMSGTVNVAGSEKDDPALKSTWWFRDERRERLEYDATVERVKWLFHHDLHRAQVQVSRLKRPERKAEAQRRLDAIQSAHDATLLALDECSPGWRDASLRDARRGVLCRWGEHPLRGNDAVTMRLTTSQKHVLVEAIVAGDPELQSRISYALRQILDIVDPASEEDSSPVTVLR